MIKRKMIARLLTSIFILTFFNMACIAYQDVVTGQDVEFGWIYSRNIINHNKEQRDNQIRNYETSYDIRRERLEFLHNARKYNREFWNHCEYPPSQENRNDYEQAKVNINNLIRNDNLNNYYDILTERRVNLGRDRHRNTINHNREQRCNQIVFYNKNRDRTHIRNAGRYNDECRRCGGDFQEYKELAQQIQNLRNLDQSYCDQMIGSVSQFCEYIKTPISVAGAIIGLYGVVRPQQ